LMIEVAHDVPRRMDDVDSGVVLLGRRRSRHAPEHRAPPGGMARTELLLLRGVLHVLLDVVLGGPRLLLGVAHVLLRVTLRLVSAAVGVQRVLGAVGRVRGGVLDVFYLVALCKRRQRKADGQRRDHALQHVLISLRRPADGPAVLRQGAHAPFGAQRSGGPPAFKAAYRSFGWLPEGAVSTGFWGSVGWPVTSPGREDVPGSLLAPLSVLGAGGRATLPRARLRLFIFLLFGAAAVELSSGRGCAFFAFVSADGVWLAAGSLLGSVVLLVAVLG